MNQKCEAVLGTIVIDGENVELKCSLDLGHEKPYYAECSCGRHDDDFLSVGRKHEVRYIGWGEIEPITQVLK